VGTTFAFIRRVQRSSRPYRSAAVLAVLCVAAAGLAASALFPMWSYAAAQSRVAPSTDPTRLPRLTFDDLKYVGAFRLPAVELDGDSFNFGGGPIAFNAARNSLYVATRTGKVAEVTVPTPANSADVGAMPFAELLQPFADPAEGQMKDVGHEAGLAGLLVYQQRLYGTGMIFYDATNEQRVSHFSRPLALNARGAGPMRRVGERGRTGLVAGYLAHVPQEWQSRLGGPAITGQCCVAIITRTSWGPAAFAWNPVDLTSDREVHVDPLVYYDSEHPTLGPYVGSAAKFGGTTTIGGLALINGTRTALFVGATGTGEFCYGVGTSDKAKANTTGPDGERYCFDPTNQDKTQHAYPYRYQMWAYDLAEWAEVRAGRKDPWEVEPYGVWPFELPIAEPNHKIIGVAFDPERRRLFVSQRYADRDGYAFRPLIHVYQTP
jgi:hypothetical protein